LRRISHVIAGSRPVTADLALRFAKAVNQTPQYWPNLRTAYDLAFAAKTLGPKLTGIKAVA
jgi:antitoxin HigA-1